MQQEEFLELIRDWVAYGLWMRPMIHAMHLNTNSYSQHKALEEYYEEIDDEIDAIAEMAMGQFYPLDLLEGIAGRSMKFTYLRDLDAVLIIKEFNEYCARIRQAAKDFDIGWLQNSIEGIQGMNQRTTYKLMRLH